MKVHAGPRLCYALMPPQYLYMIERFVKVKPNTQAALRRTIFFLASVNMDHCPSSANHLYAFEDGFNSSETSDFDKVYDTIFAVDQRPIGDGVVLPSLESHELPAPDIETGLSWKGREHSAAYFHGLSLPASLQPLEDPSTMTLESDLLPQALQGGGAFCRNTGSQPSPPSQREQQLKFVSSRFSSNNRSGGGSSITSSPNNSTELSKGQRSHYAVERRYRANLNGKFEELRDYLAQARTYLSDQCSPRVANSNAAQGRPWQKLSKKRVIDEALAYICYLEKENDEAMELIERLESKNFARCESCSESGSVRV